MRPFSTIFEAIFGPFLAPFWSLFGVSHDMVANLSSHYKNLTRHGDKVNFYADLVTMSTIMSASPHDMNFEHIFEAFLDLTRHGDKVPAKVIFRRPCHHVVWPALAAHCTRRATRSKNLTF